MRPRGCCVHLVIAPSIDLKHERVQGTVQISAVGLATSGLMAREAQKGVLLGGKLDQFVRVTKPKICRPRCVLRQRDRSLISGPGDRLLPEKFQL